MAGSNSPAKLDAIRRAIVASVLLQMFLSPNLWLGSSSFPACPALPFISELPHPVTQGIALVLLCLLLTIFFVANVWVERCFLALAALFLFFDLPRLQPWSYQYWLMLACLACRRDEKGGHDEIVLNPMRMILVCTYFWSGVSKLNHAFAAKVVPWLLHVYGLPHWVLIALTLGAAGLEIGIGLALLFPSWRRYAVYAGVVLHALILICLIRLGWETVVWPWNVAMVVFLYLLFYNERTARWYDIVRPRSTFHAVAFVLLGLLPGLHLFGLWDTHLSSAMYCGREEAGVIEMDDAACKELRGSLGRYIRTGPDGKHRLDIQRWAQRELNATAYPEERTYRQVAVALSKRTSNPAGIVLTVYKLPGIFDGKRARRTFSAETLGR